LTRRIHDGRKFSKRLRDSPLAEGTTELVERFTLIQQRRGLMESTISLRRQKLLLLAEWLYPRGLLDVEREDIEQFLDERSLGSRARYAYISHYATFYGAMVEDGLTESNPTAYIHRPRMRIALPRPIGDDDLADAIAQAPPVIAAAMILAAYQGLRSKEIAQLQREDIIDTNDPPMLHVREGKGGKDRVLPLHPDVMPALRRAEMPKTGRVLQRPRGGGFPPWALSQAVNVYLHEMGIDATLHQLRHWFGTKTYQATRDLRLVQALLGHASPTSTAVYAQYAIEGAESAVTGLKVARRQTLADHDDPRELSA
jgi:integrase